MALNYYRLLGIPPDSEQQRIKTAYRSLAKRFHPDRNSGSETAAELFRQVNDAYKTLANSKRRAEYDNKLAKREKQPATSRAQSHQKDPQKKFNHFVKSLLDAMFGPINAQAEPNKQQSPPCYKTNPQKVKKTPFNFHYNLAMEKNKTPYVRGSDGVFRKTQKNQNN